MTRIVFFSLFVLSSAVAQQPQFEIANVHVSPRSEWVKTAANQMQGGFLNAGRYELRRATMLDMIRTAWAVDADKVCGGPNWLDYDRFEVVAKAPPTTRPEALRLMLQSLLADRFGLAVRKDTKPVPAWVLRAGKGRANLKAAAGSDAGGCQSLAPTFGDAPTGNVQCRGVTMEAFASALRRFSSGYFEGLPVVDSTGLDGAWDFDLHYPLRVVSLSRTGPADTSSNGGGVEKFTEAVEKQLGLKLERREAPQPVLAVERVNEAPSGNPPGVAAALPPLPPPEFEVASIKPCDGKGPNMAPRFESGGRVTAHCMYLNSLIHQYWGLALFEELPGAPKWLSDGSAPSFSIEAKAPRGTYVDAQGVQDRDALNAMMRALLVDRFRMKFHYEDRLVDAQTLIAVKPRLTKADPADSSARTACTRQNPPGGQGSALRLVCKNITMDQFSEQLQAYDTRISYPVLNRTGIEGAWDFTVDYDIRANLPPLPLLRGAQAAPAGEASDPSGAISLIEVIEKQIGLRLEKSKRMVRVMVLDHIEERATDN
ncbi:MAG TPA: TIGR03435 family protein [Bryobacteraceae bacterium]|nr:TIGR03435 family protein [Bryobacteraceae bacterium]